MSFLQVLPKSRSISKLVSENNMTITTNNMIKLEYCGPEVWWYRIKRRIKIPPTFESFSNLTGEQVGAAVPDVPGQVNMISKSCWNQNYYIKITHQYFLFFFIFSYIFCTWLDKDDYLKSSWNDIKITMSTLIFTSDTFCTGLSKDDLLKSSLNDINIVFHN